jgi:hypothetical protein
MADRPALEPDREKLAAGDRAVLDGRKRGDPLVGEGFDGLDTHVVA